MKRRTRKSHQNQPLHHTTETVLKQKRGRPPKKPPVGSNLQLTPKHADDGNVEVIIDDEKLAGEPTKKGSHNKGKQTYEARLELQTYEARLEKGEPQTVNELNNDYVTRSARPNISRKGRNINILRKHLKKSVTNNESDEKEMCYDIIEAEKSEVRKPQRKRVRTNESDDKKMCDDVIKAEKSEVKKPRRQRVRTNDSSKKEMCDDTVEVENSEILKSREIDLISCLYCKDVVGRSQNMTNHLKERHSQWIYFDREKTHRHMFECMFCNTETKTSSRKCREHMMIHHQKEWSAIIAPTISCPDEDCQAMFRSDMECKQHVEADVHLYPYKVNRNLKIKNITHKNQPKERSHIFMDLKTKFHM